MLNISIKKTITLHKQNDCEGWESVSLLDKYFQDVIANKVIYFLICEIIGSIGFIWKITVENII